jgi:protein gp37
MARRFWREWQLLAPPHHFGVKWFPERLDIPLYWKKPRRILCCSMGDLFHESVPFEFLDKVFDTMIESPPHTYLLLTKRPENMKLFCERGGWDETDWPNLRLGVTVCNQAEADEKIPILLQIPAAYRWLSIEPMLSYMEIMRWLYKYARHNHELNQPCTAYCRASDLAKIDWIVVGCESGPNRRECKPEWIKSIVDQCKAAVAKCYVKQMEINGKVVTDLKSMPPWAVQETLI